MLRHRLLAAVLVFLAAAAPGWSCSLAVGAPPPTNYELVRDAQAIVLARSVSWAPSGDEENNPWGERCGSRSRRC